MRKILIRIYRAFFDIIYDLTCIMIDIIFMLINILIIPIKIILSEWSIFKMELENNIDYWHEIIEQKILSKYNDWYNIFIK